LQKNHYIESRILQWERNTTEILCYFGYSEIFTKHQASLQLVTHYLKIITMSLKGHNFPSEWVLIHD